MYSDHFFDTTHLLPAPTLAQLKQALHIVPPGASLAVLQKYRKLLIAGGLMLNTGVVSKLICGFIAAGELSSGLRLMKQAVRDMTRFNRALPAPSPSSDVEAVTRPIDVVRTFDRPLASLQRRKETDWVVLYSNVAIAAGYVSVALLSSRTRALVAESRYVDVPRTFDLFEQHSLKPTGAVYDDVVLSLLKNGDLVNANEVLLEKAGIGHGTTTTTCLALLDGMRQFGGNKFMEAKILLDRKVHVNKGETTEVPGRYLHENVVVLNRMMSIRIERRDIDAALELLDFYDLETLPFDLALPVAQPPPADPAPAGLDRSVRPRPDIATFTILVGLSVSLHRFDCALDLFTQSQDLQLGLNEHLVGALVRAITASGDIELAKEFFFGLSAGRARLPNRPLDKIPPFTPTSLVFEALWRGVLRSEGLAGANAVLSKVAEADRFRRSPYASITVTDNMVLSLLEYLTAVSTRTSAVAVNKMCASLIVNINYLTKGGRKPSIEDLNYLLESAWVKERFKSVSKLNYLSRRMEQRPVNPPLALDAPASLSAEPALPLVVPKSGRASPSALSRIQASLASRGVKDNIRTTTLVLRNTEAFQSIDSRWEYLQREVIDRGFKPNYHHFAYIIRAYLLEGDTDGARQVLGRAEQLGCEPHVSWYSILIGGYDRMGKQNLVRQVYAEFTARGMRPDRIMFNTLALGYARRGDVEGVATIIFQMGRSLDFSEQELSDDVILIGLRYRALIQSAQLLAAQLLMRDKLKEGIVFDLALIKILHTTGRWLRNKTNAAKRGGGGRLFMSGEREMDKIIRYHAANLHAARKAHKSSLPSFAKVQLEKMDSFWAARRVGRHRGRSEVGPDGGAMVERTRTMSTVKVRGTPVGTRKRSDRGRRREQSQ